MENSPRKKNRNKIINNVLVNSNNKINNNYSNIKDQQINVLNIYQLFSINLYILLYLFKIKSDSPIIFEENENVWAGYKYNFQFQYFETIYIFNILIRQGNHLN